MSLAAVDVDMRRPEVVMANPCDLAAALRLYEAYLSERVPGWQTVAAEEHDRLAEWLIGQLCRPPDTVVVFLANVEHQTVGIAMAELHQQPYGLVRRMASVDMWYVEPGWRGRGLGMAMYEAVWRWAATHYAEQMIIAVDVETPDAAKWQAHGYRPAQLLMLKPIGRT